MYIICMRRISFGYIHVYTLYIHLHNVYIHVHVDETVFMNVLAGMTSGAVASAIANPTDVLKVYIHVEFQDTCTAFSSPLLVGLGTFLSLLSSFSNLFLPKYAVCTVLV